MAPPKPRLDPEIQALIPALGPEERAGLEASLRRQGCLDPLTLWEQTGILLDGHNRLEICGQHGIPYSTRRLPFDSRNEAILWTLNYQLNRRNLSANAVSYLRGKQYNLEKLSVGRPPGKMGNGCTISEPTAQRVADKHGVSSRTIKNDGKFAAAVDTLVEVCGSDVRTAMLSRDNKVTRGDIHKLAKLARDDKEAARKIARAVVSGEISSVKRALVWRAAEEIEAEQPPLPAGQFRVLVIDPPWEYSKRVEDRTHRASLPYPSMSLNEIAALPVRERAHDDAILWLWTTNAHLEHSFGIARGWGFEPKTILTWVKDKMGTGDWLRGKTEHCLLCVRGRPVVKLTNQTTELRGQVREHSRKPEEFYGLVEELCPGSKLEFFARERRDEWEAWGNETERF